MQQGYPAVEHNRPPAPQITAHVPPQAASPFRASLFHPNMCAARTDESQKSFLIALRVCPSSAHLSWMIIARTRATPT